VLCKCSLKIIITSLYLVEGLAWWDWPFTWCTDQMLSFSAWHCWLPVKIPDMTYNVFGGTLNPTLLLPLDCLPGKWPVKWCVCIVWHCLCVFVACVCVLYNSNNNWSSGTRVPTRSGADATGLYSSMVIEFHIWMEWLMYELFYSSPLQTV